MRCQRCEELMEELYWIRQAIRRPRGFDPCLRLTPSMAAGLALLLKREICPASALAVIMTRDTTDDYEGSIRAQLVRMRRRLSPYGIHIEVERGRGYYLSPESKAQLRRYCFAI